MLVWAYMSVYWFTDTNSMLPSLRLSEMSSGYIVLSFVK